MIKKQLTSVILITLCIIFLLSKSLTSVSASEEIDKKEREYAGKITNLVNGERSKVNLPSLVYNALLTHSAHDYAQYMARAKFFSHTAPDNSTFISRNLTAGYNHYTFLGENLAGGQRTPELAMVAWMNSKGHKANILNNRAKEIGVGYIYDASSPYKFYWVQEFGAQ